ncbi:hypothetical protein OG205_34545 [Lentzea sp. NBC_00516]|uniref:hypothetical protein n=1 Tax=Lentzea sp. NBC_00516 TaxID=2903582 RepID=UPI002E81C677|nr:hypothetical protein [Lentzea sp. NBC_00516]WUD23150.1 hypothetical protein OG205_34545 [Lentzea sp. NBC_00516]
MAERVAVLLASLALVAGCGGPVAGSAKPVRLSDGDRAKFKEYYSQVNKAGDESASKQAQLLKDTQHPDFKQKTCDLRGATIKVEPTWTTLRMDADWAPPGEKAHPRGDVYVVAVTITLRQEDQAIGSQIGSLHVVLLDDEVYGFAPCLGG